MERDKLLAEIEAMLPLLGISESTFGARAVGDGRFVQRLRERANQTTQTLARAEVYVASERRRLEGVIERFRHATLITNNPRG